MIRLHEFLAENLKRARFLSQLLQQPEPIDGTVRTVTYASGDEPTLSTLVLAGHEATEPLLTVDAVTRRRPELLPRVTVPGDGYIGIEQVRHYSSYRVETTDPREVPEASYMLRLRRCNHRYLLRDDVVLTNLMLNLCRTVEVAPYGCEKVS